MYKLLFLFLFIASTVTSCKEQIITFSTPVKISRNSGLIILPANVPTNLQNHSNIQKGITGILVSKLEPYAVSYSIVSKFMPQEYKDFPTTTSEISVKSFSYEKKLLDSVLETYKEKDIYSLKFNLFPERFAESLKKRKLTYWKPEFILIVTIEDEGVNFGGSRLLRFYTSIFSLSKRKIVWGISFSKSAVNNTRSVTELVFKSVNFISDKINIWLKNKTEIQKRN